jgi:hypothetical protein
MYIIILVARCSKTLTGGAIMKRKSILVNKSITVMSLAMVLLAGCHDSSRPKKDPHYPDDTMTKWGPKLSEEERARIAKLSTTELVEMLKTGDTLHKFAALRHLRANGGWKKNFDLLLSIAADKRVGGDMIVEGMVSEIDESASAEDKRLVDKFLDFLESELKKDESSVSHSQVVRSLGKVALNRRRLELTPMSMSHLESIKQVKPPYGYRRVITTLISCLDNKDRNVRDDAIMWLGTVGAEDLALANKVIAALEAQLAKEETIEKKAINDNRRKVIEGALNKLRRQLRGPESPEDIFEDMFES